MPGDADVLLVLEDGPVREHCIRLAFELAKRLSCGVDALLLRTEARDAGDDDADDVLASVEGAAREEGIVVTRHARTGDPGSELLKHIALQGGARVMVWGGAEAALGTTRHARKGDHWFIRVREKVNCPVVTAKARTARPQRTGSSPSRSRKP